MAGKKKSEENTYAVAGPGKSSSGAFSQVHLNQIFQVSPTQPDRLVSRENSWLEFKKSFNWGSRAKYARTCVAFANARGGFLVFGVGDNPRTLEGLQKGNFKDLDPERVSEFFNEFFAPEIEWYMQIHEFEGKEFGLLYIAEARNKPVICTKTLGDGKEVREGEIYYRYRGRTQTVRYPELREMIEAHRRDEQMLWLKHIKQIARIGVREAGIFDLNSGEVSGAGGTFVIDEALLEHLTFIREGEFHEKKGAPAVKIIGNAEVVGKGILPLTKKIYKTKAIRTPDIIKGFLNNVKVDGPEEYLRQICFESSGFLPVYHYLKQLNLTRKAGIKILQKVQSTSPAKKKIIERLEKNDDLRMTLPSDQRPAGKTKLEYRKKLIEKTVELKQITDETNIKYLLQTIRTLDASSAKSKYLREILQAIFDEHYGVSSALSTDLRNSICYIDALLNRAATDEK